MRKGDKVQVWDSKKVKCLGWGTVNRIDSDGIPVVKLEETGMLVAGKNLDVIPEKKAIRISERIRKDLDNINE